MGCHPKLACAKSLSGIDLPEQSSDLHGERGQSVHLHMQASFSPLIKLSSQQM